MARTYPATYPAPDPDNFRAGEALVTAEVAPLVTASNFLHGEGRAQPIVEQGWSGSVFIDSNADATFRDRLVYRIPEISDRHTDVQCSIRASAIGGGGGDVKFTARNATADAATTPSVTIPVPAGAAAWIDAGSMMDVTFTGNGTGRPGGAAVPANVEQIEIETSVDVGATSVTIHEVMIRYDPDASALTAGTVDIQGQTFVVLDTDETNADEPMSADLGRFLAANVTALRARPKAYMMWSGAAAITAINNFETAYRRVWCAANPGASSDRTLTYHVLMDDDGEGGDQSLWLQHGVGGTANLDNPNSTKLTHAGGVAAAWKSGTVELGLGPGHAGDMPGAPMIGLTHIGASIRGSETDNILAICIWGP